MKKILIIVSAVLCLNLIPRPATAKVTNRAVAIVGSKIITERDLQQAIKVEHPQDELTKLPPDEQQAIISKKLDSLIDDQLIALKATASGISVSDENVDDTIARILKQNNMTQEVLEKALNLQGLTFKSYRNKIASDLLKARFISKVVKANIIITNQEIIEYAKEHDLFDKEESVTLAQIFIPNKSPNAVGGEKNKIWKEIHEKLKNEENFYALASEYSEGPAAKKGGRLGTFKKGNLLSEIEKEAYKIPLGDTSDVIKSSLGYHMIVVSNRTGPDEENSLTPDEEEKIKTILYNKKLEQSIKKLSTDLRQEYKVRILR